MMRQDSTASRAGVSEKEKDFVKFMKHFCTRLVQSVVQARMGQMAVGHSCSPNPETPDWFNLIVDEIGEIAAYMKSGIKNYPPKCAALSLDFLLHTADGDSLPLESWVVRVDRNQLDENVNVHTALYHQMSTLLKSVIMASRFTPSYRYYVRKQSPETFVLFYRVFEGEPDLSLLGEEQKFRRIGFLPTPFGTIHADLHYRTKMEITPAPYIEPTIVTPEIKNEQSGDNVLFNQASIPYYGNAVPAKGSTTVAVSPVTDDINSFSTSPLSNLGRSTSSTDESTTNMRHPSGSSKSDTNPNSPKTPSSFPQRTSSYRQVQQIRNNSFPFASLLMSSQMLFDQSRSQLLPKVPEDAVVLHSSKSDRGLDSRVVQKKRFSSLSSESAPFLCKKSETLVEENGDNTQPGTSNQGAQSQESTGTSEDGGLKKKVVFGCSAEEDNKEEEHEDTPLNTTKDDEEDRMSSSSNDSYEYVKVIGFASTEKIEDMGSDLSEFVKEVRLAPDNLHSFLPDNTDALTKQIDEFKEKSAIFDSFVAGLKDASEEQ